MKKHALRGSSQNTVGRVIVLLGNHRVSSMVGDNETAYALRGF